MCFLRIYMDKKVKVLVTLGVLILVVAMFYLISYTITKTTGYSITGKSVYSKEEKIQLGNCLKNNNVVLYCSDLAISCMRQRKELDGVFEYINYVDCSENSGECQDLSLPAWKIDDKFYYGIKDLQRLSDSTGCKVR